MNENSSAADERAHDADDEQLPLLVLALLADKEVRDPARHDGDDDECDEDEHLGVGLLLGRWVSRMVWATTLTDGSVAAPDAVGGPSGLGGASCSPGTRTHHLVESRRCIIEHGHTQTEPMAPTPMVDRCIGMTHKVVPEHQCGPRTVARARLIVASTTISCDTRAEDVHGGSSQGEPDARHHRR